MNLIVAVDKNWAIGNKGKLLVSIPSDMKFFREETSGEGKVVILGRKTLETFPGGRPPMGPGGPGNIQPPRSGPGRPPMGSQPRPRYF